MSNIWPKRFSNEKVAQTPRAQYNSGIKDFIKPLTFICISKVRFINASHPHVKRSLHLSVNKIF